jgi:hypothetical protein
MQVDKHGQGDGEDQPQAAATEQQAAATEAATDGAGQEPAAKDVTDSEDEYYGHGSERSYPGDSEVDMSIQQNRIVNEEYDSDLESDEYEGNDYMVFMGNEFGFLAGMYDDDDDFEDPYEYDEAFDDYDVDEEEDQDEDEEEDQDEDGPGGNIDPAFLFGHLSRSVYARLVQSLPLLEDFVPTPLDHELAVELSLRTLPLAPNGEFPHLRGTTEDVKILSPTLALAARELDSGRVGVPPKHATINAATFHRLPSRVQKVMDRMQSRAYIGRFTDDGSIFVGTLCAFIDCVMKSCPPLYMKIMIMIIMIIIMIIKSMLLFSCLSKRTHNKALRHAHQRFRALAPIERHPCQKFEMDGDRHSHVERPKIFAVRLH